MTVLWKDHTNLIHNKNHVKSVSYIELTTLLNLKWLHNAHVFVVYRMVHILLHLIYSVCNYSSPFAFLSLSISCIFTRRSVYIWFLRSLVKHSLDFILYCVLYWTHRILSFQFIAFLLLLFQFNFFHISSLITDSNWNHDCLLLRIHTFINPMIKAQIMCTKVRYLSMLFCVFGLLSPILAWHPNIYLSP